MKNSCYRFWSRLFLGSSLQPTCLLTNQLLSLLLPLFYGTRDAVVLTWVNLKNGVTRRFCWTMGFNPPILQARLTVDDQLVRLSASFNSPAFSPDELVDNRIHWTDPIYPDIPFHSIWACLGNAEITESYDLSAFLVTMALSYRADALPCPCPASLSAFNTTRSQQIGEAKRGNHDRSGCIRPRAGIDPDRSRAVVVCLIRGFICGGATSRGEHRPLIRWCLHCWLDTFLSIGASNTECPEGTLPQMPKSNRSSIPQFANPSSANNP